MTENDVHLTSYKACTGWQATLSLLLKSMSGKTRVVRQKHLGPLQVQRAFYPEVDICHLYLLHPPSGVVGGDSLSIQVELQSSAKALITMPGATKLYRSCGITAKIEQLFSLQSGSVLEWLPPSNIFFPGCQTKIKSEFRLDADTRLIAWETFCFGLPVMKEAFKHGNVIASLRLWREGQLLLNEVLRVDGNLNTIAGYPLHSTVIILPADNVLLDSVRKVLELRQHPAGATLIDDLMVIRLLDKDNLQLEADLRHIWSLVRPKVFGRNAIFPRIWST